ncbi:MAG: GAF domain-containing protein, partial [Anaerolineae bacterium]|nr:GAF domain-containing protein [Anaerolineae bacterium]
MQRDLALTGAAINAGMSPAAALDTLLNGAPALHSVTMIDPDGSSSLAAPQVEDISRDWRGHAAFEAITAGDVYAGPSANDTTQWVIAVPGPEPGGALVALVDVALLWQAAVDPAIGDEGYAYLVADNGALLALAIGITPEDDAEPASFAVFEDSRNGKIASRIYWGLSGASVVGRAHRYPDAGYTVITETPLSEFYPVVVRMIGLWGLGLLLTVGVGEWLIRRILRTVVGPLEGLGSAARAVGAGDYGYRVRMPEQTDRELAEVGLAFNDMIKRLADTQRQLDAYTNEMQEIVDLRARELSRKSTLMEAAAEVSHTVAKIHEPRVLVARVVELIQAHFGVYHAEILLIEPGNGRLVPGDGLSRPGMPEVSLHDATTSVIAWVANSGNTLYVPDVKQETRYRRADSLPASRCELAIPLVFEDTVLGVMNLEADHRDAFPKDQIDVLEALAGEIALSIHNARSFRAMEQANNDLAQATMQANQANTLKSRFLFSASQKLRPPLDAIVSVTEMMLSGVSGEIPGDVLDQQRQILNHGRVMQALVEDMLDLSAIEAGHMQLALQWVTLPPLLEEVTNAARALHMAAYAQHSLEVHLDLMHLTEALPPVWADVDRLRYILINLMSNAVKYTEKGEVVLSASATDADVLITVRDTGPGIGDDEMRYLFEPFQQQSAPVVTDQGTGLGLPVARLLAMRHGGDLTVETRMREGTTFTLRLPCHPDGAPPPP